jgi:hypothetical protein
MDRIDATTTAVTAHGSGLRRTLTTVALAVGLLVAGGTAVVFAASPVPGASTTPAVTDDGTGSFERPAIVRPDCPDAPARSDEGTTDDGASDDGATDDGATEDEDTTPSPDPTQTPTQEPSPTATPAV